MIETVIEVLRGGKPGDRHWLPSDWDPFDARAACGARVQGMVVDHTEEPRRLTCLECRRLLVLQELLK